uniref:Uncharacterized protein n=1 Tax=Pararge aegeria TaxID=116150 RepID=S4PCF1_9NEOP
MTSTFSLLSSSLYSIGMLVALQLYVSFIFCCAIKLLRSLEDAHCRAGNSRTGCDVTTGAFLVGGGEGVLRYELQNCSYSNTFV